MLALKCKVVERREGKSDKEYEKVYTYSDLKELQSKLTLVAGDKQKQNKDTIRRFDEVNTHRDSSYCCMSVQFRLL